MKLSKNFSLKEFLKSNTAARLGIDNTPTKEEIESMKEYCKKILQPVRDHLGDPIRITSGFRCKELNDAIGGSKTSDHMRARASDNEFYYEGEEMNSILWKAVIELDLPFYQMIWEYGDDYQCDWVHVAYRPGEPQRKVGRIVSGGKYIKLDYGKARERNDQEINSEYWGKVEAYR